MIWAWRLVSVSKGRIPGPPTVVREVSRMARKTLPGGPPRRNPAPTLRRAGGA